MRCRKWKIEETTNYFPTVLPRPAEVLQKTTRSDDGPTTPGRKPGEARKGPRRLLLGEDLGKLKPINRHKFLPRPRKMAREPAHNFRRKSRNRGGGNYSWEKTWGSSRRVAETTPGGSLGEACRGSRRLLLETLPEMLRDPAQTFAGGYFLEANWRKGHEAPSNEILQFPRVFPHFGQKSWGPPHGS